MGERDFPNKIDWVFAAAAAGTLLFGSDSHAAQTRAQIEATPIPPIVAAPSPEAPVYHPQYGPFPYAKRVPCKDAGVNGYLNANGTNRCPIEEVHHQ